MAKYLLFLYLFFKTNWLFANEWQSTKSFSISNKLAKPNSIYTKSFTLKDNSAIDVQTWSYGGGTSFQNEKVISGGFDPVISLFRGQGDSAELIEFNDDGTCPPAKWTENKEGCNDSHINRDLLAKGEYTLVVTISPRHPKGKLLSNGFGYRTEKNETENGLSDNNKMDSFNDIFGHNRSNHFFVDVVICNPQHEQCPVKKTP